MRQFWKVIFLDFVWENKIVFNDILKFSALKGKFLNWGRRIRKFPKGHFGIEICLKTLISKQAIVITRMKFRQSYNLHKQFQKGSKTWFLKDIFLKCHCQRSRRRRRGHETCSDNTKVGSKNNFFPTHPITPNT